MNFLTEVILTLLRLPQKFTFVEFIMLLFKPKEIFKIIRAVFARKLYIKKNRNNTSTIIYTKSAIKGQKTRQQEKKTAPDSKKEILIYGKKEIIEFKDWEKINIQKFDHAAKLIKERIGKNQKIRMLDLGVGEGRNTSNLIFSLNNIGVFPEIFGCDLTFPRINNFHSSLKIGSKTVKYDIQLAMANATKLPYPDNFFDLVYSHHCLEQIPREFEKAIDEAMRVGDLYFALEPTFEAGDLDAKINMIIKDYVIGIPRFISNRFPNYTYVVPAVSAKSINPTIIHIIQREKPSSKKDLNYSYVCPETHEPFYKEKNLLVNKDRSFAYPIINGIPLLEKTFKIQIQKNNRLNPI